MSATVRYGKRSIDFETTFADRTTIEVRVEPDQSVHVRAPKGASELIVHETVRKRARWIVRQQAYFRSFVLPQVPREYVSGETHHYLGRQYRLKVMQVRPDEPESVKLVGPHFRIATHAKADADHVKAQLDAWYRTRAGVKFSERFEACYDIVRKYDVEKPDLQIRTMRKRWGSCTPRGRILLNVDLIRAPLLCVDYVVFHELSHLKHPHHGPAFYRMLSRVMPDWERAKAKLRHVQP